MQSNILYSHSTTLPNIHGHFQRPRLDKLLEELINRHLVIITAGAGCGKTHAISSFLQHVPARVFWFQLSELDNNLARFWEEFIYVIASLNQETAQHLEKLGFPETLLKFDKFLHILAKEIYSSEQVIFAFDDFHLIEEESILRFVQNLILAKLENFCIIINSRTNLSFNINSMLNNGQAGRVTAEDLYFTLGETEEYLRQQGIALSDRELQKVQDFTAGWPLALYLVSLSVKKGGVVAQDPLRGATSLLFAMIEQELFEKYPPQLQNFLVRASLLNSFPEGLLKDLAGPYVQDVLALLRDDMFIYHNPYTGYYDFHHLFLEFLGGKQQQLSESEIRDTYFKAAQWCEANDLKIEALHYYDKCGCYDKILQIMLHFGVAIFSKSVADLYISLIDKFPPDIMAQNPLLHVHRAGLLHNNAEVQAALEELNTTQKQLESGADTPENRAVLGELYCMQGLINLGMANYDFIEQFKKASEYLPQGSLMIDNKGTAINTRYAIMLSSPQPGELHRMEQALFHAMPYASQTMHGYGEGLQYLAAAEAAYFCGDTKASAKQAYQAIYTAREKNVADIVSSAYFLLMRIEAANGNYDGVLENLRQTKAWAEGQENTWNFNGMPDVADGWFNLLFGNTDKLATWLVDENLGYHVLAPYSIGMERTIKARYLLKGGKYYELLAWLAQNEKLIRQYNIWLILLDILVCKAIAYHQINDKQAALKALEEAYQIAHGNNLLMPFVELGHDMRAVIYSAKQQDSLQIPAAWLDEIHSKAATYEKYLRNMRLRHQQSCRQTVNPGIKVTKREKELLGYLCQGLTNAEIASACFITISAVKKMLNNIYIKLGATNRADAVRTAIQLELTK